MTAPSGSSSSNPSTTADYTTCSTCTHWSLECEAGDIGCKGCMAGSVFEMNSCNANGLSEWRSGQWYAPRLAALTRHAPFYALVPQFPTPWCIARTLDYLGRLRKAEKEGSELPRAGDLFDKKIKIGDLWKELQEHAKDGCLPMWESTLNLENPTDFAVQDAIDVVAYFNWQRSTRQHQLPRLRFSGDWQTRMQKGEIIAMGSSPNSFVPSSPSRALNSSPGGEGASGAVEEVVEEREAGVGQERETGAGAGAGEDEGDGVGAGQQEEEQRVGAGQQDAAVAAQGGGGEACERGGQDAGEARAADDRSHDHPTDEEEQQQVPPQASSPPSTLTVADSQTAANEDRDADLATPTPARRIIPITSISTTQRKRTVSSASGQEVTTEETTTETKTTAHIPLDDLLHGN